MGQTINIHPITRIEGHASIAIQLDDQGEVRESKVRICPSADSKNSSRENLPRSFPGLSTASAAYAPGSTTWHPTRRWTAVSESLRLRREESFGN